MYPFSGGSSASHGLTFKQHHDSLTAAYAVGRFATATDGVNSFTIGLLLPDRKVLGVKVIMPAAFPRARPSIVITSSSFPGYTPRHATLDASGQLTGSRHLNSWTPSIPIGSTLTAVMDDFARSPPVLVAAPAQVPASSGPYGASRPVSDFGGVASFPADLPGTNGASVPVRAGDPPAPGQLPSYPGAAPVLPGFPAAAAARAGERTPVPRQRIPDIPSAFPALESMTFYPLQLLREAEEARRQFLKENVDALRMKREGLQMQFKANMEAATGLVSLASAQSTSTESVGEQIAVLLVQKQEAERLFAEARTRVQSVLRRLDAGALAARLPDKQDEAASIASAARDAFLRGAGAPPASAAGEAESPERTDWLDAALEDYVAAQTRYHKLAAVEVVARTRGVAPPSAPARTATV